MLYPSSKVYNILYKHVQIVRIGQHYRISDPERVESHASQGDSSSSSLVYHNPRFIHNTLPMPHSFGSHFVHNVGEHLFF